MTCVHLLDVNVLVSLAWPQHVHHSSARAWFAGVADRGWATAALTETGFIRVSCNPRVVAEPRSPQEAAAFLSTLQEYGAWEFWKDDVRIGSHLDGVRGYRQITDAHLLQLAADRGGAVATFDAALGELAHARGQQALVIPWL